MSAARDRRGSDDDHHKELVELLNELRVALPGVQVLFAFLLTVPFTGRFASLTTWQTIVFAGAFLATGVASILLMAPTAYHRIRFRGGDEERLLRTANRSAVAGLVFLAAALVLVVYLVLELVGTTVLAVIGGAAIAGLCVGLWFVLPLSRRWDSGP